MKQQTCDRNRLDEFLQNELTEPEEQQFTEHLDECVECREELESRAAEQSTWQEASSLLGRRIVADCSANSPFVRGAIHDNCTDSHSPQIEQIVGQLAPTDDPESLGRIGGYEVTGVVGAGGMGVVLKAHDRSLDRIVAIKVMSPHLASHGSARKRFAREAKAAAAVLHPNVIAIHSVASDEDCPYLVMPYLRGASLQKRIDSQGPLPLKDTLRIASQIAAGLAAAHEQGLVHRDIKPANILLEEGVERVTITDFGLARAVDDASMTRSGIIAGTPQYMSPEQTRGEPIDARSDLFSLGSVLYSMCAGRSPFRAETTYGVLHRIANDEPTSICEVNSDVPVWLGHIIEKLMAKRPDDRFESATEVAELLEDCLAHVQQPATTPLPVSVEELVKSFDSRHNGASRTLGGFRLPPISKLIATAAFGFSLIFAGVLIVLELNKGTLTIECDADDVPIRISQGKKVVKRVKVKQGKTSTRIRAGQYVIEIDDDPGDFLIEDNTITLAARGNKTVVITQIEDTKPVPVMREIEGKLAPVSRRQASERTGSDVDSDVSQSASTVQVVYHGPKGLVVNMWKNQESGLQESGFIAPTLENHGPCPSRWNLKPAVNEYKRIRLTGLKGHDEVIIHPTLMLLPPSRSTESFLAHNAIPIEFTTQDFEQVLNGNRVRKVIYLPFPELAGPATKCVETLVSTHFDQKVNLLEGLERRGSLLAIVEIGDYVKRRTETCEGMPLAAGGSDGSAVAPAGPAGISGQATASSPTPGPSETVFMDIIGAGDSFVYLIDVSSSMSMDQNRRLNLAKSQLVNSLRLLKRDQSFQVFFYSDYAESLKLQQRPQKDLYQANTVNIELAESFIASLQAHGGTSHLPALKRALELQPDVIYFLTDGDEPPLLASELNQVKRMNRSRTQIHVVELASDAIESRRSTWLHQLAQQSGGKYRRLQVNWRSTDRGGEQDSLLATKSGTSLPQPGTVQVEFEGPKKARVTFDTGLHLVLPEQTELRPGHTYKFDLHRQTADLNVQVNCSIEIAVLNDQTREYLSHFIAPVQITDGDIEHCLAGNELTKAIYVSRENVCISTGYGVLETLVSSHVDAGTDVIAEAKRKGDLVAVLHASSGRHYTDKEKTSKPSNKTTQTDRATSPAAAEASIHFKQHSPQENQSSSDHFSTPEALLKHLAACQNRDDVRGVLACYSNELAQTFAASNLMLAGIMLQDFENNPKRNWTPGTTERMAELQKLLSEQIAGQSAATAAMAFGLATHEAMDDREDFGESIEAGADAPMVQLLSAVTAEHLKDPREFVARFDEICDGDEEEPKAEKTFSYRITKQKGDTAIATDLEGNKVGLKRTEAGWRFHDPYLSVPVQDSEDDDESEVNGPSEAIPAGTR